MDFLDSHILLPKHMTRVAGEMPESAKKAGAITWAHLIDEMTSRSGFLRELFALHA